MDNLAQYTHKKVNELKSRGSVTRAVNQALERIRRKFDFEAHYELAAGGLA